MKQEWWLNSPYACGWVETTDGVITDAIPIYRKLIGQPIPNSYEAKEIESMAKKTLKGVVSMVSEKDWEDRETGEEIVLYSFQIEGDKRYFRTGTDNPGISEGDCIKFIADSQGNKVKVDSIEEIEAEDAQAPKPKRSGTRNSNGGSGSRGGKSSGASGGKSTENWDARGKYWENKEKRDIEVVEPRITYGACAHDAVALVSAALAHDALSFGSAAKGKKLDMLCDFVDQVAGRFYEQRMNGNFVVAAQEVDEDE